MKAAIIGSSNLGLNGMAERNIIQVADILEQIGYDVTIFTPPNYKENESDSVKMKYNINTEIFKTDIFARKSFLKLTNGRSVGMIGLTSFNIFYKQLINYDLYYFVNPDILFLKMTEYFYKHNIHPSIILGNHGTYVEYLNRKFLGKPLIKLLNKIIFPYIKRLDIKVQVQNDFQHYFYRELGVPEEIIINLPQYNFDYRNYHIGGSKNFTVLCNCSVRNIIWRGTLKKVVSNLNSVSFHFISYRKKPETFLKKLSVFPNVKIFRYPDNEARYDILAESDIMINLSRYEPLNTEFFEAPLSGLPLLCTNVYSAPKLNGNLSTNIKMVSKPTHRNLGKFIMEFKKMRDNNVLSYTFLKNQLRTDSINYFYRNDIETSMRNLFLGEARSNSKISIVTASLNEADNIKNWLDGVFKIIELNNIKNIDEIVIVDDGSKDGTLEIIENYRVSNSSININLIKRNQKMGTLDAQIAGAKNAKNPFIIVMDCDLQHPVEYIKDFVDKFNEGYSIVIGSRYIVGAKNNWESNREVISRIATILAHTMFPFTAKIKDPLSGYFMCQRRMLADLKPYRYMYKPLLYLLIFNNKNKNYREIPIEMRSRLKGESKIVNNYSKTVIMYSRELLIYYRDYNKFRWRIYNKFFRPSKVKS
jgi:glycosyltransferase involved in cell wall biosynthesis